MIREPAASKAVTTSIIGELLVLFKARIVLLLMLAAAAGAFLGARGLPRGSSLLLVLITGGLSAMGASALNEYLESPRDALMGRTRRRPLVTGSIGNARLVLFTGIILIVVPVVAALFFIPTLALFLGLGAFIYVVIYTLWLKPRTSLNIVIGGAAGSCAVLAGGAASNAWHDPGVLALALLLFFWTPIHFWALALVYKEDYLRAGVPMLPVRTTPRRAAFWGLVHGFGAAIMGVLIGFHPAMGPIYFVPVLISSIVLLAEGSALVNAPTNHRAWHLFHTSNGFLAVVLLAVCVAAVAHVGWPW